MNTMLIIGWLTIASYSTSFHPGQEQRNHNIRLAAAILNGKTIRPGETFSFNTTIGERTEHAGFVKAPYLEFGEKLDVEGGGICLVSSVVYNTALLAGMEIVERFPHSRQIPYLPAGQDATVDFGQKDLKFKNNLSQPVGIETSISGDRLVVRLISPSPLQYQVRIRTVRFLQQDGMLRVIAYRDYQQNGQTYRQEMLSEDLYPTPRITPTQGASLKAGGVPSSR